MMHGDPQNPAMDWSMGEHLMAESPATQTALHMRARVPSHLSTLGTTQSLPDVPLQTLHTVDKRILTVTQINDRDLMACNPVYVAHAVQTCVVVSPVIR